MRAQIAGLAVALTAILAAPDAASANTTIGVADPSFSGAQARQQIVQGRDEREVQIALTAPDGARAELIHLRAADISDVTLNPPRDLRGVDRMLGGFRWLGGTPPNLGQRTQDRIRGRFTDWRPFTQPRTGQACVGMLADWAPRTDDRRDRPSQLLFGYLCAAPGQPLSGDRAEDLVRSVTLPRLRADGPAVTAAAADGFGHQGFPFRIGIHFTPDDGDEAGD